ncbi:helix-turn-helix domain-containing protein [Muricauda sp. JGD-17]|uniref:Helix-turn-helix domain-containing protein n=1 Tax=Flagellimonas ochracea TaxID=2696472 RepID=A0A964TBD7_9FLAO|nr:AraC family transcriptional regulator [Allomuricauda ochracea]NAY91742.1 helix-turn-helix domain-containing protein [Allomuricauda ochracea]
MHEIVIANHNIDSSLDQLHEFFGGTLEEKWGERILVFNNQYGQGTIKSISFDWGVSLVDYDVNFTEELKLVHQTGDETPVEFIFISEGNLKYKEGDDDEALLLERYQNIIIAPRTKSRKTFVFPKWVNVKVNFIQILKKQYLRKKNNNLSYLNDLLSSVFKEETLNLPYMHLGNFNLEIENHVKEMRTQETKGIIKTLGIEGRLNIILAMQLLEHHKFENRETLPSSLTTSDIKKIHELSGFIVDNISEPLTIAKLSKEVGLSAKKLQTGFKMLYSKTVNEYIKLLKLEIARDYLKKTDLTVSEIVYLVGIRSRSYFSKIFSEHYGILPTEYRARIKRKTKS